MYDLNIVPITQVASEQSQGRIGFQVANPPRRAARSRSEDLLILHFTLSDDRISDDIRTSWLDQLTQTFYKTSGSVTSALRLLAEFLNQTLMDRNLKYPGANGPLTAALSAVALHQSQMYTVQSGLSHVYMLTKQGLEHYFDATQADRGLGVSRTPTIRYFHAELSNGGYLMITRTPPLTWNESRLLSNGYPNLEQLKRRLLDQAPLNLSVSLVQIKPGSGQITQAKYALGDERIIEEGLVSNFDQSPNEGLDLVTSADEAVFEMEVEETRKLPNEGTTQMPEVETAPEGIPELLEDEAQQVVFVDEPIEEEISTEIIDDEEPLEEAQASLEAPHFEESPGMGIKRESPVVDEDAIIRERQIRQAQLREKGLKGLVAFFDRWHKVRNGINTFFMDIAARWSSDGTDGPPKIPQKTLLMIAVIVPLILVAIASGVYIIRGRSLQYDSYYDLAEAKAASASIAGDPQVARNEWAEVLGLLEQAEFYKETEETALLKARAQTAIDQLDGAIRLRYHSAIVGSLPAESQISRIISYGVDLYLLDATNGRVIHALGTGNGYEVDGEFICQSGNYSGGSIDKLVDMVSMPPNNAFQAHILGIDSIGNVIYCAPEQNPIVQSLPAPTGSLDGITRIAYESNTLYVLNPQVGTIFIYSPTNGQYLDPPKNYFEDTQPAEKPDFSKIVDLDVNGPKLYLLRSDGLMAECETGSCTVPVTYLDNRSGSDVPIETLPGSNYLSVIYNAPPDSTISVLDGDTGDIYQFSLSFRLNKRLRPEMGNTELLSTKASAFTIAMDRVVFIAFGNQVFFAYID